MMRYKLTWSMCLLIISLSGTENKNADVNCSTILRSSPLKHGGILRSTRRYLLDKLMGQQDSAVLLLDKSTENRVDLEDKGDCILHLTENIWQILYDQEFKYRFFSYLYSRKFRRSIPLHFRVFCKVNFQLDVGLELIKFYLSLFFKVITFVSFVIFTLLWNKDIYYVSAVFSSLSLNQNRTNYFPNKLFSQSHTLL